MHRANTFSLTITAKNESQFLRDTLTYHLLNGCERIYLFFDGTEDDSRDLASTFDERVVRRETISPDALVNPPDWIRRILPMWHDNYDVRKRINTYVAALEANAMGTEWLFTLDADEALLFANSTNSPSRHASTFLSRIPPRVHQILLPPLEAIATGPGTRRPMVDCEMFLNRFPATDAAWKAISVAARPFLTDPKHRAWLDYWFYRVRFRGHYPRLLRHPITGEAIPTGFYLGYWNHKAGIRTAVAHRYGFNTHMWAAKGRLAAFRRAGFVLHYDLPNAECYRNKFQQRNAWYTDRTKVFYTRHALAALARELPPEAVDEFFVEQLAITDPARLAQLQRAGIVRRDTTVSNALLERAAVEPK